MTIGIVKKFFYKTFGLTVCSEIPLNELVMANENEEIDLFITLGDLSHFQSHFDAQSGKFIVKEYQVMFQIPNTATFCIKEGNQIIVSPMHPSNYDKIRLYILGTCMGAILMQRGIFPLHGSAIAIDGEAYAFIGESGAGKSTLASAFIKQGYSLLSDDVLAIELYNDETPYLMPSYPQQKLWKDSLEQFGMETSNYQPLFERETKYSIPVSSKFSYEPVPLAGIFELVKTQDENIQLCRVEKLEKIRTLFYQTFRHSLINRLGLTEWHFKESSKIVNKIEFVQLRRPVSGFTAHNLVSRVLSFIKEGEVK